jgi:nicotinamidase-related amidase
MSDTAIVIIDMLNPYDHEHADQLAGHVAGIIDPLRELISAAEDADAELVYVNDNYGDFAATRDDIVRAALDGRHPELVEPILPPDGVDFLQKVRHSGFYSTALDHLLRQRGITTLVLAGQVTEQCILYTALDAYVRQFSIRVPRDAVAPVDPSLGEAALDMMERNMRVEILGAAECVT